MAVEQLVQYFGFNLGFVGGIVLGFVAGIVVAVRPHGRDPEYLLAIGRPDAAIGFGGDAGELARRADEGSGLRMKELHVELGGSVADGGEEDMLAVRREAEAVFSSLPRFGESVRRAAGKRDDPQMRILGVVGEGDIDGGESDPARVRRNREVADTLEVHHVLKGEWALLREGGERDEQDGCKETATQHTGLLQ